jgi:hypothetical protein
MTEPFAIKPSQHFEHDKYVVLKDLVSAPEAALTSRSAEKTVETGLTQSGDDQVRGTPCRYGDPMMDGLVVRLLPAIEQFSGLTLFPTYSYFRVYKHEDALERHIDRQSCEISLSMCLGYIARDPWPMWIEGPDGTTCVSLATGDALVFRGLDRPHWREAIDGERQIQLSRHFVDRKGPPAE